MRNNKKWLARLLAVTTLVTMLGAPCVAFAEQNGFITKDETVYVITDDNGKAEEVIVSDHLVNNTKSLTINDLSNLEDIENVKGDEKFTNKDGRLTWEADGKDIYYRGKTDKAVPIRMNITYSMDGVPYSGKEMQGKKGEFQIKIAYSHNVDSDAAGVPFVVLSGLMVYNENYSDITINNGKILDDGEKTVVVGIAAPGLTNRLSSKVRDIITDAGLGSEVIISGRTKNFDITDIMTLATNSIFDDVDIDILDNLDYDNDIKELNSGSKQLVKGTESLKDGITQLNDKVPALKIGIGQLNQGTKQLKEATKDLSYGVQQLSLGQQQIFGGVRQIYSGLSDSKAGLKGGLDQMSSGADKLGSEVPAALGQSNDYLDQANTVIEQVRKALADNPESAELAAALEKAEQAIAASKQYNSGVASSVADGATSLKGGAATLSGGIDKLIAGFEGDGTASNPGLLKSMDQLESGMNKFSDGVDKSSDTLIGAVGQLADGMNELDSQTGALVDGIGQLKAGSDKIAEGMDELYEEGIKKIVDMYNDELKGLTDGLEDTLSAGRNYNTFTQLPFGMDGTVKFVFKTVCN